MKKPTPGPWIERMDLDYYQGGTYLCAAPFYHYTEKQKVEFVPDGENKNFFGIDICRMESDNEADFNLIKAAPEMYEALKEYFWAQEELESPGGIRGKQNMIRYLEFKKKIKSAFDKASGNG